MIELKTGKPLVPGKGVHQQRNAERVEHFNTGHIDVSSAGVLEVEGKKVQVIVRIKNEPIEFDIALDLQMLSRVQQRPGRGGQAHAAHVEVSDARAALVEDMINPGQHALAGLRITLARKLVNHVVG